MKYNSRAFVLHTEVLSVATTAMLGEEDVIAAVLYNINVHSCTNPIKDSCVLCELTYFDNLQVATRT